MKYKKKLIEVALPLDAINKAAKEEKAVPRRGHPQTLHYWWARRPLAAARAVIFAQMVDDPSAHPDLFPTEKAQEKERQRLFRIIEELVLWENTTKEEVLQPAREEILQSWRYTCAENADHPQAKELFDRHKLPGFHDPFAGGGTLPLEAQRLGLESYASDLNPVAVLINKAMIEIPPKFVGQSPVNPAARKNKGAKLQTWRGTQGLAEDVRYYGQWMRDEAEKRIGHLYPKVKVTAEMAKSRPALKQYVDQQLTVIASLWTRTVKSPNPAFAHVDVPLASTFLLSMKADKAVFVEPVIEEDTYRFVVKEGKLEDAAVAKNGTKLSRGANFECVMSRTPIAGDYIKNQAKNGKMGSRLMAVIAESDHGRVYLAPSTQLEAVPSEANSDGQPDVLIGGSTQYIGVKPYGMEKFAQLFTGRELVTLKTFSELISEVSEQVKRAASLGGLPDDNASLAAGGKGPTAYSQAVAVYLGCALSRLASYNNTICHWNMKGGSVGQIFGRQAIPMSWDYIEVHPLEKMSGNWIGGIEWVSDVLSQFVSRTTSGTAHQSDACKQEYSAGRVVSTDPPYYDNVPYADLSDFFYVWLRPSLRHVFPDLFSTVAVPKTDELVAFAYRHDGKPAAERFFLDGMTKAMHRLAEQAHPAFPVTIYYAFKQAENDGGDGIASTGWETFLDAVLRAGFLVSGTWPLRTETSGALKTQRNALASSIVLVCRQRPVNAPTATRREFHTALKSELPAALAHLQRGNIAPVDLAQAAIGPGMAVYTRYAKVLDAAGQPLSVREALALINQTLDEALAEQEGDFDADSRWALAWFEQSGFSEGEYGVAETLSTAKNISVQGLQDAGIVASSRGKVRLLKPDELPADWDPTSDPRLTAWETVHQLIRTLALGEEPAAALVAQLGAKAEVARELAYRLYTLCERKKRAAEALAYNGLVQSWPELTRLAREGGKAKTAKQSEMFGEGEES